jgi:ABC-2 type transport system permease protein
LPFKGDEISTLPAGFILASIMPTVRTAWVAAMVLLYPMLFLSGAFFSVELLPKAIQKISAFMPLTYVVNLLRGLWAGQPWGNHLLDVGVLVGMLLVGIIVSVKTFRWE